MRTARGSWAGARRWVAYVLACLLPPAGVAVLAAEVVVAPPVNFVLINALFAAVSLTGVALMARAARHPRLPAAARRPWWYLLAANLVLTTTGIASHAFPSAEPDAPLILTIDVVGRCAAVTLNLMGLFAFATEPLRARDRQKLLADVGTVLGAGLMLTWYALLAPAISISDGDRRVQVVAMLLPVTDLVFLTGVFTVMMRGSVPSARRPLRLLLVTSGCLSVSSAFQAHALLLPDETRELAVAGAFAMIGTALYACSAYEQLRCAGTPLVAAGRTDRTMEQRNHGVPYIALLFGYGLLMAAAIQSGLELWPGLVVGAMVMTAAVAGRQLVVLRENHELVVTDGLTGLANRRPVAAAIERAASRSRRTGTPMAVLLFDLDGFKQVNDTLGHEAGDRMLVGFSDVLKANVRPVDLAARLGGDEFAVVLEEVTAEQAVHITQRILEGAGAGMDLGGGITPIRCSIGIAVADPIHPDGIPGTDELLAQADAAMYEAKRAGKHTWHVHTDPVHTDPVPDGAGETTPADEPVAGGRAP